MNDHVVSSDSTASVPNGYKPLSAGSLLRAARELEGLHITALAALLKVPVIKIEAVESDNLDVLPDLVFARALASSICRVLKIDPNPVLELMPSSFSPPMKTDESGINTPFRIHGEVSSLASWRHFSKPVVFAVFILLMGALILWLDPFSSGSAVLESIAPNGSQPDTIVSPVSGVTDNPAQVESLPGLPSSSAMVIYSSSSAISEASAALPLAGLDTASPIVNVVDVSAGLLVLKARDSSWLEVVDGAGVVQVRKIISAGETLGVSGVLPLAVVLGKADAVDVQVRGQPFDARNTSKDNIARFEVK